MTPSDLLDHPAIGSPQHDNSGLRARLSGHVVTARPIVAELRAAMHARETGEIVVDVHSRVDWR